MSKCEVFARRNMLHVWTIDSKEPIEVECDLISETNSLTLFQIFTEYSCLSLRLAVPTEKIVKITPVNHKV
jgi:hypothetical protein